MTEQRTPDELTAENELICEKLLGWQRRKCFSPYDGRFMGYDFLDGKRETTAPSFTTWADAGLLMDALAKAGQRPDVSCYDGTDWVCLVNATDGDVIPKVDKSAPLAIRAAALAYIRSLP